MATAYPIRLEIMCIEKGMIATGHKNCVLTTKAISIRQAVEALDHPEQWKDLPLDIRGTVFQKRVWSALRDVPAGETATYADIARRIGQPDAVRAVANACGSNKIALFVPCHRIIRSDGGLGGYRWGTDRKALILEGERRPGSPQTGKTV